MGLADAFRAATDELHRVAERSGFVACLLRGRFDAAQYAVYLRGLLAVYAALEDGMSRHREEPSIAAIFDPRLFRAAAIRVDLVTLAGPDWPCRIPLVEAAASYGRHLAALADADPGLLVAHAYVRYLGDLNGGRILKRRIAASLGPLRAGATAFHEFPAETQTPAFKLAYRTAFDRSGRGSGEREALVAEARRAFLLNIALSEAVLAEGGSL